MVLKSLRNAILGLAFAVSACGDDNQNLQYCPPGHEISESDKQEHEQVLTFGEPYSRNGLYFFERGVNKEIVMRVRDSAVVQLYSYQARLEDFFPIFPVQVGEREKIAEYGLVCSAEGRTVFDTHDKKRDDDGGYCVGGVAVMPDYVIDDVCLKMVRVWDLDTGVIDEHNLTPRFYWRLNGVQRAVPLDCTLMMASEYTTASLTFKLVYDLEN